MKNINSYRKFKRNDNEANPDGDYILYWMQINRRTQYNYALEYAVALANKHDKPLLIYESVMVNYPWASDRFHSFLLEGMKEHLDELKDSDVSHYCYAE
ncbi:MAG TPA: hypothetical protein DD671_09825, partial [Balneolaceae bacterium]|nr:hypothetical protein [Balneolaceae bacterium]